MESSFFRFLFRYIPFPEHFHLLCYRILVIFAPIFIIQQIIFPIMQNKHLRLCVLCGLLFAGFALGSAHGTTNDRRIELRDSILHHITGATLPTKTIVITSLGAKADCLRAFRKAFKQAQKQGGARIVVPRGTYFLRGPLHLVSNLCLELQEGATLKFTPDPKCYPLVNTSWEGTFLYNYSPFIYGYGLHDVTITGKGTIDGNAMTTFATWRSKQKKGQEQSRYMNNEGLHLELRKFGDGWFLRPQLLQLYQCRNITLEGVKIINSPFWCVHLLKSENIICRGLRYDAKLVNNDGIDPECSRNILIEDVHFDNGDDNIAIKSARNFDGWRTNMPTENVIIRNCHFKGLHAVVIGSEMSSGVRNVFVENCDYAGYCKRGIYVKTNPDRGGFVKNLYVNNCKFGNVEDLFYITSMYAGEGQKSKYFSDISDIYVDGLSCQQASAAAIVLQGTGAKPIRRVEFRNVEVGEAKIGMSIDQAPEVSFSNCHIGGKAGTPTQVTAKDRIFEKK